MRRRPPALLIVSELDLGNLLAEFCRFRAGAGTQGAGLGGRWLGGTRDGDLRPLGGGKCLHDRRRCTGSVSIELFGDGRRARPGFGGGTASFHRVVEGTRGLLRGLLFGCHGSSMAQHARSETTSTESPRCRSGSIWKLKSKRATEGWPLQLPNIARGRARRGSWRRVRVPDSAQWCGRFVALMGWNCAALRACPSFEKGKESNACQSMAAASG